MSGVWKFTADESKYASVQDTAMELERSVTESKLTRLGGGYMRFATAGEFGPHPVAYDELFFVLSGQLEFITDDETIVMGPGDAGLIEEGAIVTYRGTAGTVAGFAVTPRH